MKKTLNCLEGEWAAEGTMLALSASDIISLVGIYVGEKVWVLRKHPGLAMLTPEECGIEVNEDEEVYEAMGKYH